MSFTNRRTVEIVAYLLLVLALTQAIFTALYVSEIKLSRQFFWGLEGLLFTILIAFSGAAMVQLKSEQIGWSAITFSAVLNVIQVAVGVTMFGTFNESASQIEELKPALGGVVALSFMIYYAAKLLLGFAALVFGMATLSEGKRMLGGLTALLGGIAILSNAILITFGREGFLPSGVAGTSGMLATLFLAFCLINAARKA
ncbi:hypothetical protein NBRC116587_10110 [Pseudoteredinibacter isoporae]